MANKKTTPKKETKSPITNLKTEPPKLQDIYDKYISPYNIWFFIGIVFLIAFIAFGKYINSEYLFFFKDIGSDSLNQDYPAIVHKILIGNENYSFYTGMGDAYSNAISLEPVSAFRALIEKIGVELVGKKYYIDFYFLNVFIFTFLFSGILFYFYLRTVNLNKFSSLIGALFFTFSGYLVMGSSWAFSGHVFRAALLLFSFEQLYVKNRWYFFPFAVMYLSSNSFIMWLYGLFILTYTIFRVVSDNKQIVRNFLKTSIEMIILGIGGLLMNLRDFYSSFMNMYLSPRVSGNASYSQILSAGENITDNTKLTASTIYRFFSTDILGSGSNFKGWSNYFEAPAFYIGLLALLLLPQIFIYLEKRKKIIFGVFFLFWMSTIIFPYFRHAILLFTGDYFRFGFDFFIPFIFLFYGIYSLNELDKTFKINLPLLIATYLFLIVLLFFPYKSIEPSDVSDILRKAALFILLVYGFLIFLMTIPEFKIFAKIGIILLVIIELSYFSYKSYSDRIPITNEEFSKDEGGYNDGTIQAVEYLKTIDKTLFYRIEKEYQSGNAIHGSFNDAMAQEYYGTSVYTSANQLNYVRFLEEIENIPKGDETSTRWIRGFRDAPLLLTFSNVKYFLSKNEKPFFLNLGFDSINKIDSILILKNRYALPFGYTYDKYIDFNDFKTLIKYKITEQNLDIIGRELLIYFTLDDVTNILKKLQTINNIEYPNKEAFKASLNQLLGDEISNKYFTNILKYSVDNFTNQTVLLNGFVYESDNNVIDKISEFQKITLKDTNYLISADKFSFEYYKQFTDSLKIDTLQITEFKQSNIKGKINLSKTKMLFLTIPYDKNWNIKVDGESQILQRVNLGFSGIILSAGAHEIELYYVTENSGITNKISIGATILFWLILGFYIFKKYKNKKLQVKNNN